MLLFHPRNKFRGYKILRNKFRGYKMGRAYASFKLSELTLNYIADNGIFNFDTPQYFNNKSIASATFSTDGIMVRSSISFKGTAGIFSAPKVRTGASRYLKQCS
jgi:hypothetical protein